MVPQLVTHTTLLWCHPAKTGAFIACLALLLSEGSSLVQIWRHAADQAEQLAGIQPETDGDSSSVYR